ncbi:MAG: hypothetical protein Q9M21_08425 [Mariprofundaceae bacterium]|nr:hypothetical protein [Mariprofundaceae bacterium]
MAKKEKSPRQRAWKAMRIMTQWTLGDIESTAEISRANAESFVYALVKAGYVRRIQPKKNGVKGGYAVYRLVKNTGPRCPVTANYNAIIHDRNTGQDTIIGCGTKKPERDRTPTRDVPTHSLEARHVG